MKIRSIFSKARTRGAISVYAKGDDYHDVIKKRLKTLARWLAAKSGEDVKVFVDTAAVMEKPLAQAAGLGWQGKAYQSRRARPRLMAVSRGDLLGRGDAVRRTWPRSLRPPATPAEEDLPDRGIPRAPQLDARRCIWDLTIENKGPIPHEFRKAIGNRIYGCDDCLAVCPWNKFAQEVCVEVKLAVTRAQSRAPLLAELARLDDTAFRALFTKSPVKRIGRDRFIRNVLIAIGNADDASLAVEAERLLSDASPLVRGAARALAQPARGQRRVRGARREGNEPRD